MATKTQNPTTLSRFGRFGIGRGAKSHSASPRPRSRGNPKPDGDDSDEWYIPYNGPYEAPKQSSRRRKERDSWGDPINGEEEDDAVLDDKDLHHRYGQQHQRKSSLGSWELDSEREGRTRNRAMSAVSHQTVSSGNVDPGRQTIGLTRRRSTHSSAGHRQPTPSYISFDSAGGVGESPMPPGRAYPTQGVSNANKGSIASFFTFGQNKKGTPSSPRSSSNLSSSRTIARTAASLPSSSAEENQNNPPVRRRLENALALETSGARGSSKTDDEDYYNSYYSTLVTTPKQKSNEPQASTSRNPLPPQRRHLTNQQHRRPLTSPSMSDPATPQKAPPHPYAYVFPPAALSAIPQSAPPVSGGNDNTNHDSLVVMITEPSKSTSSARGIHFPPIEQSSIPRGLKTSISTPNLRSSSQTNDRPLPVLRAQLPTGKDRWLSAETWCDALLFPRPRFKIQNGGDQLGWSGRIVSPPPSPISRQFDSGNDGSQPLSHKGLMGVQSRVLAHSRSVADLANSIPEVGPSDPARMPQRSEPVSSSGKSGLRPEKTKSFAQDDLALPSPAPSLARVLEEGRLLERQRQKWQTQATQSFQNKRTRSLSRTRSKSSNNSHSRRNDSDNEKLSDIGFLGARAFLGQQAVMPTVGGASGTRSSSLGNGTRSGTLSSTSHSHSNSLSKTNSKSSKVSHSRGHSRNESWSKSAIKMAKSTAAFCGLSGDPIDPPPHGNERESALEDALKVDGTKVIRLADPAQTPADTLGIPSTNSKTAIRVSPTPSASYEGVGIALSTPPPSDSGHTYEPISLPDHPYAQAVYPQRRDAPAVSEHIHGSNRGSDYAGPHPSTSKLMAVAPHVDVSDVSTRHRLPPQAMLHPYAQAGSRDSYLSEAKVLPRIRMDSNVPPPAKMWAQGPSGEIEEILPSEIVYSPFTPSPADDYPGRDYGLSPGTSDTIGVGEALAYGMRRGGSDRGSGTNEGHDSGKSEQLSRPGPDDNAHKDTVQVPLRVHRKAVRYDISHPTQTPDANITHTHTSSPLEAMAPSNPLETVNTSNSSPYESSTSSGQASPRPFTLDDVDDLENFRDLFYRPGGRSRSPSRQTQNHRDTSLPWDVRPHSDRTASGLTSLARKLSDELEELNALNGPSSDTDTNSKGLDDLVARLPVGSSSDFPFIFSDTQQVVVPTGGTAPLQLPQKGSGVHTNIPEDVESSRASSPLQVSALDDEITLRTYRVGHVEAVSTPITMSNEYRASGHVSLVNEPELNVETEVEHGPQIRIKSQTSLQPPSAGITRSSYMTSSTSGSRMSGLSDFPAPPEQVDMTPAHMGLLNSYFDDSSSAQTRDPFGVPPGSRSVSRRLTFGGDDDIEDIVNALSSHP